MARAGIVCDTSMVDGILNGFDADGVLVVSLKYMPVYERLIGAEDAERAVKQWRTSPDGVRRVAAIAAWNSTFPRNPTAGNA